MIKKNKWNVEFFPFRNDSVIKGFNFLLTSIPAIISLNSINNKKNVNIIKRAHAFKGYASSYNVKILNSFDPEL